MFHLLIFNIFLNLSASQQENLDDFGWLEGLWQNVETTNNFEEWYWDAPNNRWQGRGFRVVYNDTIVYETITIEQYNGNIHYIPVIEENVGPIPFKVINYNKKGFECINTKHDFPKSIIYKSKGKRLTAIVSGNGETQEFIMQRIR